MCCKLTVSPLVPHVAEAILQIGQFKPADPATAWERHIPEEGCQVRASLDFGGLSLNIYPTISTFEAHLGKRIAAGVFFEIAAKYAEKVGGEIVQLSTVTGCRVEAGSAQLLVARYPDVPMSFDRVCAGFQAVFLGPPGAPPGANDGDEPVAY
jgi:hypothetical protein